MDRRNERLRNLLKDARKRKGLTQLALGQRLGKDQLFVSRYESGRRNLDVIEFLDIAQGIGVDPYGLLRRVSSAF